MPQDIQEPRCFARSCRWYGGVSETDEEAQVHVCPAFPDGIPDRIAYEDDDHLTVAADQVGETVFEEAEEAS